MKPKFIPVTLFLAVISLGVSQAFGSDEIPLGITIDDWSFNNFIGSNRIDTLSDSLGFNLIYAIDMEGITQDTINSFKDHGYEVIPALTIRGGTPEDSIINNAYKRYLSAHYFKIEAEDDTTGVRFFYRHGYPDSGWFVANDSLLNDSTAIPYTVLDSLWFCQEWHFFTDSAAIRYHPVLKMRMDPESGLDVGEDDTLAFLNIYSGVPWSEYTPIRQDPDYFNLYRDTIYSEPILVRNLDPNGESTIVALTAFGCPECTDWTTFLTYQIVSTGKKKIAIDWFKVYDDYGQYMVENPYYDRDVGSHIAAYCDTASAPFSWQLRDDMMTDQLLTTRHLDSIIVAADSEKAGMMKYCDVFIQSPKVFKDWANPKRYWINFYPFYGGGKSDSTSNGPITHYFGDENIDNYTFGLQGVLNFIGDGQWGNLHKIKADLGNDIELWYTAQLQADSVIGSPYFYRRYPTGPEMRLEAFFALSFGIKGLQYWPYCSQSDWSGMAYYYKGLMDNSGNPDTAVWNRFKTHVTPYIQAIDEYYAPLTWEKSYNSHQIDTAGYYASSIHGWSDSPNPDTGWAQIGEFHNDTDKYIMLVNRACNMEDGSEAPPQHFVLEFNRDNLGLGNSVYIIDLADTVCYNSLTHHWEPVPETTYSTGNPLIPFTTTLAAGEGKLIKISKATTEFSRLVGDIYGNPDRSPGFIYQGDMWIFGDVTIKAGRPLNVRGPANLRISAGDSLHSGLNTNKVELIVNGRLNFQGSEEYPINLVQLFSPGTLDDLNPPMPGDWYGIRDLSDEADTLSYCTIKYAYDGFKTESHSNAVIRHCEISHCQDADVYLYCSGTDSVRIDTCLLTDSNCGLYARSSLFLAHGNTLTNNSAQGIYLYLQPSNDTTLQSVIEGNIITKGDASGKWASKEGKINLYIS